MKRQAHRVIDGQSRQGASRASDAYIGRRRGVIRNFMAGVAWGTVVAGLGLAIISEVAPLPGGGGGRPLQTPTAVIVPSDTLAAVQPEPAVPVATVTAPVVAAQTEAPVQGDPAAVMPAATGTGPTDLTGVAPVVIEALPQPAPVPDVAPVAEAAPQPEAQIAASGSGRCARSRSYGNRECHIPAGNSGYGPGWICGSSGSGCFAFGV